MNKNRYFSLFFLLLPILANAQVHKSFHQIFEMSDSVSTIELKLVGAYEWEHWAGNTIMLQTKVELYDASQATLDYFWEKDERYTVEGQSGGKKMLLFALKQKRPGIKVGGVQCFEIVKQLLFIPEGFELTGEGVFVRPEEDEE